MVNRTPRRVLLVAVLVGSLILTLVGRLYYLQVLDPNKPVQSANALRAASLLIPAERGQIVDDQGRPLVDNVPTQVVTVNWETLQTQPNQGAAVLKRLAALLGVSASVLGHEITPCGTNVPNPCWTGEPYQPVPVDANADTAVVLAISEHREDYPGVTVQTQTELNYPGGSLAAQVLGYAGAVSAADEQANPSLHDADTIGRSGLEQQYDSVLRGVDGTQTVELDPQGYVVGQGGTTPAQQGDTLVTSLDSGVQALAEKAMAAEIAHDRSIGKPATSGALIVMDPNSGRIIAAASYPTYDPQEFVGGISAAQYAALTSPSSGDPLIGRAIDGNYAPGSTFKLITTSSDVTHGELSTTGTYPCPGSLNIDGATKTNYDSESFLYPLTLKQALDVSCDTFFYAPAVNEYYADQTLVDAGKKPNEYLQQMAAAYGLGTSVGIDLPADEQTDGTYSDREIAMADWKANRATYCAEAKTGYPNESDPSMRSYLELLASQNCTDGWRYNAGENADMAIGQGATTLSPLQLALAYSAMINGGTLWRPTIGWAVVDPNGKVVRTIQPTVKNKVPVSKSLLATFANDLQFTDDHTVSGALAFDGAPYKTELGGKTGTAQVEGQLDTSWLASWGPVGRTKDGRPDAKFVVVGMVEQGGTGASSAAPMVRQVYNGLLGVGMPALLPGSHPITTLPSVVSPTHTAAAASLRAGRTTPADPAGSGAPGAADVVPTFAAREGRQW